MEGGSGGGDSEVQRTMLELLNQLDGFEATNKIKVGMHSSTWEWEMRNAGGFHCFILLNVRSPWSVALSASRILTIPISGLLPSDFDGTLQSRPPV